MLIHISSLKRTKNTISLLFSLIFVLERSSEENKMQLQWYPKLGNGKCLHFSSCYIIIHYNYMFCNHKNVLKNLLLLEDNVVLDWTKFTFEISCKINEKASIIYWLEKKSTAMMKIHGEKRVHIGLTTYLYT